jgi:hypothetical protein
MIAAAGQDEDEATAKATPAQNRLASWRASMSTEIESIPPYMPSVDPLVIKCRDAIFQVPRKSAYTRSMFIRLAISGLMEGSADWCQEPPGARCRNTPARHCLVAGGSLDLPKFSGPLGRWRSTDGLVRLYASAHYLGVEDCQKWVWVATDARAQELLALGKR